MGKGYSKNMPTFHDPFRRYPSIDESNYLEPKIEHFLNLTAPDAFHEAVRRMISIRDVLRVAKTIGRSSEISRANYYMHAVQWLNKQISISNYVAVPRISDNSQIDDAMANNFNSYMGVVHNKLISQALYTQIQIMHGVIENKIIGDVANKITTPLEDDFTRHLANSKNDVTESMNRTKQENESQLSGQFHEQIEAVRIAKENAITEFEQARALANWSSFYAEKTLSYRTAVQGKSWPEGAVRRKYVAFCTYRKSLPWSLRIKTLFQFRYGFMRCVSVGMSILYSKATSYLGKRTFWFLCLMLAVFMAILINVAPVYDLNSILGIDLSKLRPAHNDTQLFAKIFIYIGFFLIPTLGYSFANKNYRIYSNLLEQYSHREVVARTIQGILARPRGDEDDEKVRQELTNVAATALFEQKTIGHLSKNEANSVSILDIARLFRG